MIHDITPKPLLHRKLSSIVKIKVTHNFIKATLTLGLKDEEIGEDLKIYIKNLSTNL